jgi:Subtilisin inhibitor-like
MTRRLPHARYLLIAVMCSAAATACGSTAAPAASPAAPPKVSLDIKITGGTAKAEHWTLRCEPTGGTHPDAAAACRALLGAKDPFARVSKGLMCPMILASTRVARVTGTYFGQQINTTFVRDGCGNLRWAKIGQIFN